MAKLVYFMPMSLNGCIGDETGDYDWSAPDEEVFGFINDTLRPCGTYLYGRKMYETMAVWETPEVIPGVSPAMREFAKMWQGAEKVVYSRTLEAVGTGNTRLEREFELDAIRGMKQRLDRDLAVSGPTLAAQAIRAGAVDEYQLLVAPALIRGGIPILPADVRFNVRLAEERRFRNGMVFLRYRAPGG